MEKLTHSNLLDHWEVTKKIKVVWIKPKFSLAVLGQRNFFLRKRGTLLQGRSFSNSSTDVSEIAAFNFHLQILKKRHDPESGKRLRITHSKNDWRYQKKISSFSSPDSPPNRKRGGSFVHLRDSNSQSDSPLLGFFSLFLLLFRFAGIGKHFFFFAVATLKTFVIIKIN